MPSDDTDNSVRKTQSLDLKRKIDEGKYKQLRNECYAASVPNLDRCEDSSNSPISLADTGLEK